VIPALKQEASSEAQLKCINGDHLRQGLLSDYLRFLVPTLPVFNSASYSELSHSTSMFFIDLSNTQKPGSQMKKVTQ
jgi:hypothetical protein